MIRLPSIPRLVFILLVAAASLPAAAHGQTTGALRFLETGRKLVVSVRARPPGPGAGASDTTWSRGSGIILGLRADSLFVATTHHGVESVIGVAGAEVDIYLHVDSLVRLPASVRNADKAHDLAVLAAVLPADLFPNGLAVPFSRAGDPGLLARGDVLLPVGCPLPGSCQVPVTPSLFSTLNGPDLVFEANNIIRGFSGGALFTSAGELVGMIKRDRPPSLLALRLDTLVQIARGWGVPVHLARPPVDPYSPSYSVAAVGAAASRRSSGMAYGVWVERAQDLRGPIQHLQAVRLEAGDGYSSVGMHAGLGARGRLGRVAPEVTPTSSVSAFLDVGVALVEAEDVESQGSIGWSAGLSLRWEFTAVQRAHGGVVVEARKMGSSFTASSADVVTAGIILGWRR